jgi:hypothetical protein
MTNAEDLPGGIKARSLLKMLASRPGPKGAVSQARSYVEALYPELREARAQGWPWTLIRKELLKIPELPNLSLKVLSQYFLEADRRWAKETGVPPLVVRKISPQKGHRRSACEPAEPEEDQPKKRRGRPPLNRTTEEAA